MPKRPVELQESQNLRGHLPSRISTRTLRILVLTGDPHLPDRTPLDASHVRVAIAPPSSA